MTKLKDQPFALLGVNVSGNGVEALRKTIEKEKLTWRSFSDTGPIGEGPIARRWNVFMTPTFYLLDAKGVIRRKWAGTPGARVIDRALERLLDEARRQ